MLAPTPLGEPTRDSVSGCTVRLQSEAFLFARVPLTEFELSFPIWAGLGDHRPWDGGVAVTIELLLGSS